MSLLIYLYLFFVTCQGFLSRYTPDLPIRPSSPPLFLAGVGTFTGGKIGRYGKEDYSFKIAVSLAIPTIDRAKRWILEEEKGKHQGEPEKLVDCLLEEPWVPSPNTVYNPLKVGITIRFGESMPTEDFIHLFRDAFRESSWKSFRHFEDSITRIIGRDRIRSGEELNFYWFDDGDLMICKNGEVRGRIVVEDVNRSLLAALVDKQKAISKDLLDSLKKNMKNAGRY